MRRDKGKGQGWKNIVPIGMGGFLSGSSNVTKHSIFSFAGLPNRCDRSSVNHWLDGSIAQTNISTTDI